MRPHSVLEDPCNLRPHPLPLRWSSKKRSVPKLGDASSTLEEVDAFYSYW